MTTTATRPDLDPALSGPVVERSRSHHPAHGGSVYRIDFEQQGHRLASWHVEQGWDALARLREQFADVAEDTTVYTGHAHTADCAEDCTGEPNVDPMPEVGARVEVAAWYAHDNSPARPARGTVVPSWHTGRSRRWVAVHLDTFGSSRAPMLVHVDNVTVIPRVDLTKTPHGPSTCAWCDAPATERKRTPDACCAEHHHRWFFATDDAAHARALARMAAAR